MSTVAELVAESRGRAANPDWLGSEAHLELLDAGVRSFDIDAVEVLWAPPGGRTYSEAATGRIVVERPHSGQGPVSDEDLAEYTAIGLLHEVLHLRFSSPSTLREQLVGKHPWVQDKSEGLFNYLEDARVARLAIAEDPDLADPIASLLDAAVDSLPAATGFIGPGTSPSDPRGQLPFAIMAYALRPARAIELHPAVAAELDRLKPTIDQTRTAGETDDCVAPAIELIEQVVHFQP